MVAFGDMIHFTQTKEVLDMTQDENKPSLGDIVRYMVLEALASDDGTYAVPVRMIHKKLGGYIDRETCDSDFKSGGKHVLTKLKASYVSNTASRMQEVKDADKRARFSMVEMDFDGTPSVYCAKITMVDGAVKVGSRSKTNNQVAEKSVNDFKARILKLMPSVTEFEGDEITGAIKAIKMYQDMIKEAN